MQHFNYLKLLTYRTLVTNVNIIICMINLSHYKMLFKYAHDTTVKCIWIERKQQKIFSLIS